MGLNYSRTVLTDAAETRNLPHEEGHPSLATEILGSLYWVIFFAVVLVLAAVDKYAFASEIEEKDSVALPRNLWALNLSAAVKQARIARFRLPVCLVLALSICLGIMQLFVLFLVVSSIDPTAHPVTKRPSSPWVDNPWSVNAMKWAMACFLSLFLVKEADDVKQFATATLMTNPVRMVVPKGIILFMAFLQLGVVIMIIWGGVTAVLSFGSVPDILYSSMSISFIAQVDDAFYTFLSAAVHIEGDFIIHFSRLPDHGLQTPLSVDDRGTGTSNFLLRMTTMERQELKDDELKMQEIWWVNDLMLRCIVILPICYGLCIITRAMDTNVMPSTRAHNLKEAIERELFGFE